MNKQDCMWRGDPRLSNRLIYICLLSTGPLFSIIHPRRCERRTCGCLGGPCVSPRKGSDRSTAWKHKAGRLAPSAAPAAQGTGGPALIAGATVDSRNMSRCVWVQSLFRKSKGRTISNKAKTEFRAGSGVLKGRQRKIRRGWQGGRVCVWGGALSLSIIHLELFEFQMEKRQPWRSRGLGY